MTRCVAVSGAASGIGQAVYELLAGQGHRVIGIDLEGSDITVDLSTADGRQQAVTAVSEACGGRLDGLVACAGISGATSQAVRVNYFGATELVAGLRPALAAAEQPRVAVIGSVSGFHGADAEVVRACLAGEESAAARRAGEMVDEGSGLLIYPSSKAALAQWARRTCVLAGWADAGIPLNVVAPGVVLTDMSASLFDDDQMKRAMDRAVPMPLNGYAGPEVVANVLAWLIGPENTHITGQVLYVDGGAEATVRGQETF